MNSPAAGRSTSTTRKRTTLGNRGRKRGLSPVPARRDRPALGQLADVFLEQPPGVGADLFAPFAVEAGRPQLVAERADVGLGERDALLFELGLQRPIEPREIVALQQRDVVERLRDDRLD